MPAACHIQLWEVPLATSAGRIAMCEDLLSTDERKFAAALGSDRRRRTFTVARGALREILAAKLGGRPRALRFRYGYRGKPELDAGARLGFNVSHSGDMAVIAVAAGHKVGVDVERVGRKRPVLQIARRHFAPAEAAAIEATRPQERMDAFLRCWTAKEAYMKALGHGFALPLDRFEVSISPTRLVHPAPGGEGARFEIHEVRGIPGHRAALATDAPRSRIERLSWPSGLGGAGPPARSGTDAR